MDMRLTTNAKQAKRLIAKPNFKFFKIINEDLTLVTLSKTEVVMNEPMAVGTAILDISKQIVYDFHYNYILPKYGAEEITERSSGVPESSDDTTGKQAGSSVKVLFSDTDSLCYYFEGVEDIYEEMRKDSKKYFDLSDFPKDHKCYSDANKKRLCYFKDETAGVPIVEFVGLRSKMYSISLGDGSSKNTAKGIQHHFYKTNLKHELYRKCLVKQSTTRAQYNSIRSFDHQLYTIHENKVALSSYDDKRYLLKDSHDTLAYGHYGIPKK